MTEYHDDKFISELEQKLGNNKFDFVKEFHYQDISPMVILNIEFYDGTELKIEMTKLRDGYWICEHCGNIFSFYSKICSECNNINKIRKYDPLKEEKEIEMIYKDKIKLIEFEQEILKLLAIKDQINESKKIKRKVRSFMESNRETSSMNFYYINLKKKLLIFLQSDNAYSETSQKPLRIEKLKETNFVYKILEKKPEIIENNKYLVYLREKDHERDIILNLKDYKK